MSEFYDGADEETLARMVDQQKEVERLTAELEQCQKTVTFFASVIKSGEDWSCHCQSSYDRVFPATVTDERCQHVPQTHVLGDKSATYCMKCDERLPDLDRQPPLVVDKPNAEPYPDIGDARDCHHPATTIAGGYEQCDVCSHSWPEQ